jgi:DNA-directed RNA polymerase subunit H
MATEKKQHFDIMNHELVPFHTIISDDEKEKLLKKYNVETNNLPKILDNDPVCVFIGAKSGQIVKIVRKSNTAKEAISYRLVIESE